MKRRWARSVGMAGALCVLLFPAMGQAQLSKQFTSIFDTILKDRLILSPGTHKNHYVEAATQAESLLTPALNGLIVSNITSFPLSSTTPGVTFDFSGGELVSITEGLGPIFADRATTVGRGKFNVGFNATFLDLSMIRGLATDQMRFTFTHRDLNGDGILGGPDAEGSTEGDYIDVTLGTRIKAYIFAFYGTIGITRNLDIGVAVPVISIQLSGTANARISSFTYANGLSASHFFAGTATNPVLETSVPYSENATGIGDIAVRLKYSVLTGGGVDLGALVDVRIPTGKADNFLGSGKTNVLISGLLSKRVGDFAPHLNLGYEFRAAEFQSDRVVVKGGFDQKILQSVTFAADFLGTFDVNKNKAVRLYPGTITIMDYVSPADRAARTVSLSNIPDRNNDNLYNLSAGFKFVPSPGVLLLANMLVPLNDGGLRAQIAPTIGLNVSL